SVNLVHSQLAESSSSSTDSTVGIPSHKDDGIGSDSDRFHGTAESLMSFSIPEQLIASSPRMEGLVRRFEEMLINRLSSAVEPILRRDGCDYRVEIRTQVVTMPTLVL